MDIKKVASRVMVMLVFLCVSVRVVSRHPDGVSRISCSDL